MPVIEIQKRNVAIFATGGKWPNEWGSGLKKVLEASSLVKDRVALVLTNYREGWVRSKFEWLYPEEEYNQDSPSSPLLEVWSDFPKRQSDGSFSRKDQEKIILKYQELIRNHGIEYVFLSWWMKQVLWLEANMVVNIHPGPIQGEYGGEGMYGDNVHKKVWEDYFDGRIVSSAVTMHFAPSGIDDTMDSGPIILQVPVSLVGCGSWDDVRKRVNAMEHKIQWQITEHVINGKVKWSGVKWEPIIFDEGLTVEIDGNVFPVDGKVADLTQGMNSYGNAVVKAGDSASGNFKQACDEAMRSTLAYKEWLVAQTATGSWETIIPASEVPTRSKDDIDGVGTKVQIYLSMFEAACQRYKNGEMSIEETITESTSLWERMLHDLISMNADDLRDGQLAVWVQNIIDINHLRGERWRIFSLSMSRALKNATEEIGIGNSAGETAILGEPLSAQRYKKIALDLLGVLSSLPHPTDEQIEYINEQLWSFGKRIRTTESMIDLNIWGTVQWLIKHEKLVPLKAWQKIVALYEIPDENGVIGPRSNGISSIRRNMTQLAGENWPNMTFADFLVHIWEEKSALLPVALKEQCRNLTLGQIATGKTTVFNPFVARELLGGLEGLPSVFVSSLIHVTGNPGRKIHEGLRGDTSFAIEMDLSDTVMPQILQIIQILHWISDSEMMESFNMGVPYAVICDENDAETIVAKARARGIAWKIVWSVNKMEEWAKNVLVNWVGTNKSQISF